MPTKPFENVYTSLEELPESTRELFEYHPDKARELLAEAGYADGFRTTFVMTAGGADTFAMYSAWWADVGIDVEFDVKESGAYWSVMLNKAHTGMGYLGRGTGWPYELLGIRTDNAYNHSMVDDQLVNETYDAIMANYFDTAKRDQLLKEIIPYILDQVWYIPHPSVYLYAFRQPWVGNYHGENWFALYNLFAWLNYVWIDVDLKAELTGR